MNLMAFCQVRRNILLHGDDLNETRQIFLRGQVSTSNSIASPFTLLAINRNIEFSLFLNGSLKVRVGNFEYATRNSLLKFHRRFKLISLHYIPLSAFVYKMCSNVFLFYFITDVYPIMRNQISGHQSKIHYFGNNRYLGSRKIIKKQMSKGKKICKVKYFPKNPQFTLTACNFVQNYQFPLVISLWLNKSLKQFMFSWQTELLLQSNLY